MTIDLGQLTALWQQAFGDPKEVPENFFRTAYEPQRCQVVEKDGAIGAALYWLDCLWEGKKLAYIYAVATREDLRGQGLCRLLMDKTHQKLCRLGYAGAVLVPAKDSLFSMYEKMGYRPFCPKKEQEITAGAPVMTEALSPEEYGRLRNARLPAGGILQDQAALAFLSTYGRFYRAGEAVFCAVREEAGLRIPEFLGDHTLLPGVVAALGEKRAKARLPGGSKPFAMYRSFEEEQALPEYFGLALD